MRGGKGAGAPVSSNDASRYDDRMDPRAHELLSSVRQTAENHAGLDLLVLFGSRSRGDDTASSDFGYLGRAPFEADRLLTGLVKVLGTERVDLANLERASGLLRFRAARDGRPIFEAEPGTFARFWFDTVSFWCDAEPVLRAGYEDVLERLGP